VIILTAHGTIPDAVKATQSGVASFLTKPFDGDSLITEIQQVLLSSGFVKSIHLEDKIDRQEAPLKLHKITSKSPKMVALMQQVERLAQTHSTSSPPAKLTRRPATFVFIRLSSS